MYYICRNLKGVATLSHLMNCIVSKKVEFSDPIEKALFKQFRRVDVNTSLGKVSRILEKEPFVVVVTKSESGNYLIQTPTYFLRNIILKYCFF